MAAAIWAWAQGRKKGALAFLIPASSATSPSVASATWSATSRSTVTSCPSNVPSAVVCSNTSAAVIVTSSCTPVTRSTVARSARQHFLAAIISRSTSRHTVPANHSSAAFASVASLPPPLSRATCKLIGRTRNTWQRKTMVSEMDLAVM